MSTERDYSLLRPFDLEAAKRGEAICRNEDRSVVKYIAGPDRMGLIVFDSNGEFLLHPENLLRMAPLCWVEGRPVYRGDVLWHKPSGQKVNAHSPADSLHIFAEFEHDGLTTPAIAGLTWTPPKVKREGWVNIYSARNSDTVAVVSNAHPSKYHADKSTGSERRIACVRIEWEEPAEVAK